METKEVNFNGFKANGFVMLFVSLVWLGVSIWLLTTNDLPYIITGVVLLVCWFILLFGFTMLDIGRPREFGVEVSYSF